MILTFCNTDYKVDRFCNKQYRVKNGFLYPTCTPCSSYVYSLSKPCNTKSTPLWNGEHALDPLCTSSNILWKSWNWTSCSSCVIHLEWLSKSFSLHVSCESCENNFFKTNPVQKNQMVFIFFKICCVISGITLLKSKKCISNQLKSVLKKYLDP